MNRHIVLFLCVPQTWLSATQSKVAVMPMSCQALQELLDMQDDKVAENVRQNRLDRH
jgi:hypothetical protein